jgi:cell wall-associated NlpC family hydrolase
MLVGARTKQEALAHKRASVIAQTEKFQTLLATLTAAQRQAYTTRGAPTTQQIQMAVNVHSGSAAAQKAINFALAQVGKPYVFGAAGPDAWDCSGLTMAAWAKGGVSLPHFAASQYNFGRHVGFGELQPGDLVFLYSDIHHVEIYIGDGLAVSAPEPGQNVKIVQVANSRSNFYGATRLT